MTVTLNVRILGLLFNALSDPKYCHIYHYCTIGVHQVRQCFGNLWYSTKIGGCDWPDKSDCKWDHLNARNRSFEFHPIQWFVGKAGHLYTSSTPATNMIDGDGNIVTTPRHLRPQTVYLPIECPPGVREHFPDPYDCSVFHYCNGLFIDLLFLNNMYASHFDHLGGVDRPSYCDPGLFWDKSKCSWYLSDGWIDELSCIEHGCQWPKDVPQCNTFMNNFWRDHRSFFLIQVNINALRMVNASVL